MLDRAVAGDDDRHDRGIALVHALHEVVAVHARHAQVGEQHVRRVEFRGFEGLGAAGRERHAVPVELEDLGEVLAHDLLVVDDEDVRRPTRRMGGKAVRRRRGGLGSFGHGPRPCREVRTRVYRPDARGPLRTSRFPHVRPRVRTSDVPAVEIPRPRAPVSHDRRGGGPRGPRAQPSRGKRSVPAAFRESAPLGRNRPGR